MAKRTIDPSYFSRKKFKFEVTTKEELIHNIYSEITKMFDLIEFNTFEFGISWPINQEYSIEFKHGVRDTLLEKIKEDFNKKHIMDHGEAYFLVDFNKKSIILRLKPVFIYGKYLKFSREIAQTEHFCRKCQGNGCNVCNQTGHIIMNSVEQTLSKKIIPIFQAKQLILHGAGREDSNVLMLGNGRPMVLEIICPKKRNIDLKKLEEKINSNNKLISVNSFEYVNEKKVAEVKNSVHDKKYLAIVECEEEISEKDLEKLKLNKKFEVDQRTPVRVERRRVDKIRKKEITFLNIKKISKKEFELEILTSHGTYVKEFISGDEERTDPSLSSLLGIKCECRQLDVLEIV